MNRLLSLAFVCFICWGADVFADERSEVARLATKYNSQVEAVLWDKSRVDLLSDTYAIEADWAYKWSEGVGQALYYSIVTDRKPGLLLLTKDASEDARFIYRAQTVCAKHGIRLWVERVDTISE